jgi:uncharacterized membrane protein (DUF485 family)
MNRAETPQKSAEISVQSLIAAKLKLLVPMTVIFMVGYIGLTVLAGFAKGLMGVKVIGPVNLGFVLIALNYLISWILAIVYERIANERLDALASRTLTSISSGSR